VTAAPQLFREFQSSPDAAEVKYKGRVLRVTGEVKHVLEEEGSPYVYLAVNPGAKAILGAIKCRFNGAPEVKPGERITVEGKYDGRSFVNVMLSDCTLVDRGK
jgi:hypothetical protein